MGKVMAVKLSDGSEVFNLIVKDGDRTVIIECVDENSAYRMQTALELNASNVSVS